jgi:VWFA-related protein
VLALADFAAEPVLHIRKRVSEVQFTVVAEDGSGRPMRNLSANEISVRDNGQAVPDFRLRAASDLPLRIGIMADLSGSTAVTWQQVRTSLIASTRELLQPQDQVMVVEFNQKIQLARTVREPAELAQVLPAKDVGGLTALYDSVYVTCEDRDFFERSGPRHAALILLSDGEDNLSLRGLDDAIAQAQQSNIAIYTIAMHGRKVRREGDAILRAMAENTGGRAFVVRNGSELLVALGTIGDELRSAYLLNFRPAQEDEVPAFHRVQVEPVPGEHLRVRARSGYFTSP